MNSKKQPVANRTLWEELIPYFCDARFKFEKVKGHNGKIDENSKWNEFVDDLAVEAKNL
jgi:ribonuclease HI